ncbi:MAG: 3-methyl-2-oxobutanoate hydroxymethyltransferase [Phycisphaeraceae bacterium]|nr:3-methyl-2-oxobutanoate hydroxymethyltransferase [Phycisphaeraceae bacterium]
MDQTGQVMETKPTHSAVSRVGPQTRDTVTIRTIERMARSGDPFACLTCYDATTARLLERAGVHVLLVGDSAAEVILGFDRTIDAPFEFMVMITAAVKRGAPRTMVMGDMPFMSYHAGADQAMVNAGRMMTEGRADCVKLEVDATYAPVVDRMTRAGIPVCAHVGSRPQTAALRGGYGSSGRTLAEAQRIVDDAVAMEQAGCVLLLVEAVPDAVTQAILDQTTVPLIGIGAGASPHGQVLVLQDLLGMTDQPPRFAERVAMMGDAVTEAGRAWVERVAARKIGGKRYEMLEDGAIGVSPRGDVRRE